MRQTLLLFGVLGIAIWGTVDYVITQGAEAPPPTEKKVMLRVPLQTGDTLTISAIIYDEITEITLTPVIQGNRVSGAIIESMDTSHKITVQGDALMLDIPGGRVSVGGTFSVDNNDGKSIFAVKLDKKVVAPPPAKPEVRPEPPPHAKTPVAEPDKKETDAAIQEILKPVEKDEEDKDE